MTAERRHRYCHFALLVAACALGLAAAAGDATETGDGHSDSDPTSATADEAAHADDEHTEDEHHEVHEVYAVLMPWFVQALGIVVFFILTRHIHGLPYTAVIFVLGVIMGIGSIRSGQDDQLSASIRMWTMIDYEVLFNVFLPGLLFKDAFEVNFHLFMASLSQLMCLAFPMVLAGTVLTALIGWGVFPYGWSFYQSLTFGAILAATDPVAVSVLLNEVGAPPRLKVHVSGESLLNDGSAVVFFYVFGGLWLSEQGIVMLGGESTVAGAFAIFFRMSLGGALLGFAFGLCLVIILYYLDRRMEKEEIVLQVAATVTTAYLSFYTSEVVCGCSGVISCVVCGITTRAFGNGMISDWQVMDAFWSLLEHLLNTVIFALGGIVFGDVLSTTGPDGERLWTGSDWGWLFLLYVLVTVIRFGLMFAFFPINKRIGLGTSWQEVVFASWGGLRGAVGIALALALDNAIMSEYPGTENGISEEATLSSRMFGMVGGIALLTLVINGTTSGPILMKLGLAESTESRKRILTCAIEATRRRVLDDFLHLMTDERFFFVDFALVMHHVHILKDITADELQAAVEANKQSVHPSQYQVPHLDRVLPYIKDSGRLRAAIVKSKGDFFASYVPGDSQGCPGGAHPLFGTIEEGAVISRDELHRSEETLAALLPLVKDTRVMFVELLRASYMAQIKDGELDPREYDGGLVYALFEGLDLTEDAVAKGEPLGDWTSAQFNSVTWILKCEMAVRRATSSFCSRKGGPKQRVDQLRDLEPGQYQELRMNVLLALSFIDAHKEAQDRLKDELGKGSGTAEVAFNKVMNESKAEVRKAKDVLMKQTKKKLNHVISHYLCVILLNKQARYVQQLADSGVLLPREVRHFLEEIDEEIIHIRSCPLDKHPNAIGFVDENADYDETGQFKGPVRARKRVRQKSIL